MTNYAIWKAARAHCSTITETAIGQFLKGDRSIGLDYLEAIMSVLDLAIVRLSPGPESKPEDLKPTAEVHHTSHRSTTGTVG